MPRGDKVAIVPNADGSFQLRGLRVFSTVRKGENGNEAEITPDWLRKAVEFSQKRFLEDGYAAPMHQHHSSTGKKVGLGSFVATGVEDIEYQGKVRPTIVVNARVPAWVAAKVRAGELPYRSVEIPADGTPELVGLAVMDDTKPFFQYGNMTGVLELPAGDAAVPPQALISSFAPAAAPMLAFADVAKKRAGLYEAKGEEYVDGEAEETEEGEEPSVVAEEEGAPGEEPPMKEKSAEGEGGMLAKKIDAMLAWLQRIGEKLLGEKPAPNAPSNPVEPNEMAAAAAGEPLMPNPAPSPAAPVGLSPELKAKLAEFDAMSTRLKALEDGRTGDAAAHAAQRESTARLDAAKTKLAGFNLSTKDEADLAEFAAMGQAPLDKVVAIIERRPRDVGSLEDVFSGGAADGGTGEPKEVAEFAAKGPTVYAKAKELARTHAGLRKLGMQSSLKEFLDAGIAMSLEAATV